VAFEYRDSLKDNISHTVLLQLDFNNPSHF